MNGVPRVHRGTGYKSERLQISHRGNGMSLKGVAIGVAVALFAIWLSNHVTFVKNIVS